MATRSHNPHARQARPSSYVHEPMPNIERIPPQALDAEQTVLGCLMLPIDNQAARLKLAREALTPRDFYREAHQHIFAAILTAAEGGPIELSLVAQELERRGQLDITGGRAYLSACEHMVAATATLARHIAAVRKAAGQRRAIELGGEVIGMAYDGFPPEEIAAHLKSVAGDARLATCHSAPRLETITALELRDKEFAPIRWAVPNLVPEGLTLLYGPSKIGKSFLLAGVAAGVAEGGVVLGSVPVEGGEVLYIALEDPERRLQDRHRKVAPDDSWPARLHFATHCPTLNEGAIPAVEEWLDAFPNARLVIVDTFARMRGDFDDKANVYYTEYRTMARLQELAIRREVAIVVAHHANKLQTTNDEFDTASGSTGMQAAADAIIKLKRKREETTAELVITGREIEDAKLAMQWGRETGWVLLGEAEAHFRSVEELEILGLLLVADAPVDPAEVAEELEVPLATARKRLQRAAERGFATRTSKGYVPTDSGRRAWSVKSANSESQSSTCLDKNSVHIVQHWEH